MACAGLADVCGWLEWTGYEDHRHQCFHGEDCVILLNVICFSLASSIRSNTLPPPIFEIAIMFFSDDLYMVPILVMLSSGLILKTKMGFLRFSKNGNGNI